MSGPQGNPTEHAHCVDRGLYESAVKGRAEFRQCVIDMRERATFPKHRTDPATWVLHLVAHREISVGKAGEWLRHYIQDGVQDELPKVEALP